MGTGSRSFKELCRRPKWRSWPLPCWETVKAGEAVYNRYIPQEDGSFRKSQVSEPPYSSDTPHPEQSRSHDTKPASALGIGEFLKRILPENLDIEDLIVILLLLLISQDENKDSNQALLTLGAYLFL